MEGCGDGCPSGLFSHLHKGTLELCQSAPITSLTKVLLLLPKLLSLAWRPAVSLLQALLPVCSTSFISSEIPKDWKAAAVIALFKGGDTLDPNCYRPISIPPCLSKVFESQVNKQITDHFESHCTFYTVQSGFRNRHGCTSATLKVQTIS